MNTKAFKYLFLHSGLAGVLILLGVPAAYAEVAPMPGTVELSATDLQPVASSEPVTSSELVAQVPEDSPASMTVAQSISPGRATRSGSSYVAVGGNIGFGGSTGLGRGNFAVTSKIGLTNNVSARPGAVIGDRTTFLLPATLDFPPAGVVGDRTSVAPFVGGGIAISTGNRSQVRPMITGGVDVPLSPQFTATASANVGFFRNTDVGVLVGLGYNF